MILKLFNYVWLDSEIERNQTQLYAYFWLIIIAFNYRAQINPITAFNPVQFTEQLDTQAGLII